MAGHARYTALLDACVLFPPAVADALISLHVAGLYTARWTARIERLISTIDLPDDKDLHVLAAAIAGHTDCIVTSNLKDFPAATLQPLGLEAIHPDEFLDVLERNQLISTAARLQEAIDLI